MTDETIAQLAIDRLTFLTEEKLYSKPIEQAPAALMEYLSKVVPLHVLIELKKIQDLQEKKDA